MTYHLLLGDYAYSSWSLRGWLLFEKFGISRKQTMLDFSGRDVAGQLTAYAPAHTVPTVITPEGAVVSDSLAIAEELASRHPDAGLWPSDPLARATARSLTSEMHSGFTALRTDCPMSLRQAYLDTSPSDAVLADLERIETLWAHAQETCSGSGPWLCGEYSAVDAFYAPVAARIAGFSLPVGDRAAAYVAAHLADPAFRRWRAMGLVSGATLPWYAQDYEVGAWPGPTPLSAKAVEGLEAENEACPYSGKPVTDVLELDGRRFGFCNPFCRDKTVADPEAWPAFMALLSA
ncbi:glutathione S-transferase [uncultured Shimia sp.]|uniref:glutathione S-transferase n=1 Tax=uncultured Shimia sp. TaxID=573152 RepID=UPI002633674F|nr:glutathione S-transferase [uncultured Shimia sp.]